MIILGCLRLYLLKERTHVLTVIKDFINEVKIQFFTIRVLRTDNVPGILKKILIFVHLMVFYIRLFIQTLHIKMDLLKENRDAF